VAVAVAVAVAAAAAAAAAGEQVVVRWWQATVQVS
jgi:hypothetical protein